LNLIIDEIAKSCFISIFHNFSVTRIEFEYW